MKEDIYIATLVDKTRQFANYFCPAITGKALSSFICDNMLISQVNNNSNKETWNIYFTREISNIDCTVEPRLWDVFIDS